MRAYVSNTVEKVSADEKIASDKTREITVRVEDKNLSDAAVYLGGKVIQTRQSVVVPAKGAGS